MELAIIAFLVAFSISFIVIITNRYHAKLTNDNDYTSPQKFHNQSTPRIAGVAIFVSVWILAGYGSYGGALWAKFFIKLLAPSSLIFIVGFAEDLIKGISPYTRLALMLIATTFGIYIVHVINIVTHTNVFLIDYLLRFEPLSILLTVIIILGTTNAFNIIDGYNGLCLTTFISILLCLLYIAYQANYHYLDQSILILCGASLGVLFWNYPAGKIFLGDGGAYLLGFTSCLISLELSNSFPNYSPLTSLLIAIYPISETLLAIYRKGILRKRSIFKPDGLHMHMVVYHRLIHHRYNNRNAIVVVKMLWFILPQLVAAILFRHQQWAILSFIFIYLIIYFWVYFRLISFKRILPLIFYFKLH